MPLLALLASSCNLIFGIDPPKDRPEDAGAAGADAAPKDVELPDAAAPDAAIEEDAGAPDAADLDAAEPDAGDAGLACDPNEAPGDGIFVSPRGSNSTGLGTPARPYASVTVGLGQAAANAKSIVFLDQGTYEEALEINSSHSGITIEGGWIANGSIWMRDCTTSARTNTLIASPTCVGVRVDGAIDTGLRRLSITTTAGAVLADVAGESCYGVHARSGTFFLEDVDVASGPAGRGGDATLGVPGGQADCSNLVTGCGDGLPGGGGGSGADAEEGFFDAIGYEAQAARAGDPGDAGHNGMAGSAGQEGSCFPGGCTCVGGNGTCSTDGSPSTVRGSSGTCGCGGSGGDGGAAGRSGGASVGIFAAGTAIVSVTGSAITAGDGGDGSPGGPGTPGQGGLQGADGNGAWCNTGCNAGGPNCVYDGCIQGGYALGGGARGGEAGDGGDGGDGGGGAGGPSYGIVTAGGGMITMTDTEIRFGFGGLGRGGAPDGRAGVERHE